MNKGKFLAVLIAAHGASVASGGLLSGPVTNPANGHRYYLLTETSWTAAEAEAVALGGHLVTINDEAEHNWVYSTFGHLGGVPRSLWIGLRESNVEGTYEWVSGTPLSYTNWGANEPNNAYGGESYGMIIGNNAPASHLGRWNDYKNDSEPYPPVDTFAPVHGVVEILPSAVVGTPVTATIRKAVEIAWEPQPGKSYQVQYSTSLAPGSWFDFGSPTPADGSVRHVFDVIEDESRCFYRVLELPEPEAPEEKE